jgi:hypothetical protein
MMIRHTLAKATATLVLLLTTGCATSFQAPSGWSVTRIELTRETPLMQQCAYRLEIDDSLDNSDCLMHHRVSHDPFLVSTQESSQVRSGTSGWQLNDPTGR